MASELWKTVADFVTLQRGITYRGQLVGEPGPALLGLGSIEPGGGFRADHYKTFGGECPPKIMLAPGDIYVALKGATKDGSMVGSVARLPESVSSGRLTQDTARLDFIDRDPEVMSYLYWVLRTPHYRQYCAGRLTGSASASFSREDFLLYPVPPMTSSSRTIVSLLEAIEAKIELNRRMNETLEALARALFQSWFVNFDPVRVKVEGGYPRLPRNIADLFPDRFEDSELGEIPKGWDVRPFADTVEIIGGGTPKTSVAEYWSGDIPWFSVVDAPTASEVWVIDTEKKITSAGIENSSTRVLPVGTTIISARGTVGRTALVGAPMAMNQSCYGIRGRTAKHGYFTYFATRELVVRLQQHAHGSVFDTITRDTLAGVSVALPSPAAIEAFETQAGPVLERIRTALLGSRTLAVMRDTMLPKLTSARCR